MKYFVPGLILMLTGVGLGSLHLMEPMPDPAQFCPRPSSDWCKQLLLNINQITETDFDPIYIYKGSENWFAKLFVICMRLVHLGLPIYGLFTYVYKDVLGVYKIQIYHKTSNPPDEARMKTILSSRFYKPSHFSRVFEEHTGMKPKQFSKPGGSRSFP